MFIKHFQIYFHIISVGVTISKETIYRKNASCLVDRKHKVANVITDVTINCEHISNSTELYGIPFHLGVSCQEINSSSKFNPGSIVVITLTTPLPVVRNMR